MVIIGVDPHKRSHTVSVIDDTGQVLASRRFDVTPGTVPRLLSWSQTWPHRRWAIEGSSGLGRLLAQGLVAVGESVVDVPATLSARVRVLQTGHGRKTDTVDATCVAVAALHRPMRAVAVESDAELFRLLSDRRDELVQERRRTINRLHRHLRDLIPGGAPTQLTANTAAAALTKVRPVTAVQAERKAVARELLCDVRRLDKALAANRKRCAEAIAQSGSRLTEIYGISDVLAVKIHGHVGDISRFPNDDAFASYVGTAPIEASSGDTVRHRLSRSGNRHLNHAIHMAAHVQSIRPGQGRDYFRKKLAEGKTTSEARRALKRQITKSIYRHLKPLQTDTTRTAA